MRRMISEVLGWAHAGRRVALATIVATTGSAPQPPGSAMAIGLDHDGDPRVAGSLSGGCLEAEVYEQAREVLDDGTPRIREFGAEADGFSPAVTCGGRITVHLSRLGPADWTVLRTVATAIRDGRRAVLATRLDTAQRLAIAAAPDGGDDAPTVVGDLGPPTAAVVADARIDGDSAAVGRLGRYGDPAVPVFRQDLPPPPRLLLFGAVEAAAALARLGAASGYHVTLCDPRPLFATAERFPAAQEVVVDWPHRYLARQVAAGRVDDRTAVCLFGHDARIDTPLLTVAVRAPVGYVGAMASRRTHADRLTRLRAAGCHEAELTRIAGPIGLDLGGRSPQDVALSVLSEIVARRHGGTGRPLSGWGERAARPIAVAAGHEPPIHGGYGSR